MHHYVQDVDLQQQDKNSLIADIITIYLLSDSRKRERMLEAAKAAKEDLEPNHGKVSTCLEITS